MKFVFKWDPVEFPVNCGVMFKDLKDRLAVL